VESRTLTPTALSALGPGFRVDRYELLAPVGQGGMGAVWLARARGKHGFEKFVALKTILPSLARDPALREMFMAEARLAAHVEHANVAQILDLGEVEDQGLLYIVLEWVDGRAIDTILGRLAHRGVEMPVPIALRIVADACAGLHAAHGARDRSGAPLGLVHCDVSPQNILVDDHGAVKIIDFGIARARHEIRSHDPAGAIRGKVPYMAPEQARGGAVDARTDVWGVGAVLYEMLAGAPPVATMGELAEIVVGRRAWAPLPDRVPVAAKDLVLRALSVPAGDRFPTVRQMQQAIERVLFSEGGGTPTTSVDVAEFLAQHLPQELSRTLADEQSHLPSESPPAFVARAVAPPNPSQEPATRPGLQPVHSRALLFDARAKTDQDIRRAVVAEDRELVHVTSSEEALERVRHDPIDALLLHDEAPGALGFARLAAQLAPAVGRVLLAGHVDAASVRAALCRADVHALVVAPFEEEPVRRAMRDALARAESDTRPQRDLDEAIADHARSVEEEAGLRRSMDDLAVQLEDVRRTNAHADNAARISLIGESEARRARALERPLTVVLYRMRRPAATIPAVESALLHDAITHPASVVTEQYGELVAVVPGETVAEVEARIDRKMLSLGDVSVTALSHDETFAQLLDRSVACLGRIAAGSAR
jgi:serine/threonine protein kinase